MTASFPNTISILPEIRTSLLLCNQNKYTAHKQEGPGDSDERSLMGLRDAFFFLSLFPNAGWLTAELEVLRGSYTWTHLWPFIYMYMYSGTCLLSKAEWYIVFCTEMAFGAAIVCLLKYLHSSCTHTSREELEAEPVG